jgi:hypothetical protein
MYTHGRPSVGRAQKNRKYRKASWIRNQVPSFLDTCNLIRVSQRKSLNYLDDMLTIDSSRTILHTVVIYSAR